jgi:GDP-L-fucose synthase
MEQNNFWEGKRVLVTGAAGIAGTNLSYSLLQRGAKVFALTFNKRQLDLTHKNLVKLWCDLRDYPTTLEHFKSINADVIFDLAAVTGGAKKQVDNQLLFARENIVIHINVITAACEAGIPRFGFVGSSTMYPPLEVVDEDMGFVGDPWKGYMGVGWVKRYLEKVCMHFHNITNTKFAIARTTALYGPFDDFNLETCHVIPALVHKISKRQNPLEVWGDGSERRNFIYVGDFVDGFLKVVENKCDADPINIANSEVCTVNDVITECCKSIEFFPEINYDASKPTMIPSRLVSVKKAKELLGWEASVSLRDGINMTMKWFGEHYNND